MADVQEEEAVAESRAPQWTFAEGFSEKQPGDVILQSGGDIPTSFYFRLSLLAELSTFFRTLPAPSPEDMVDGTPLIPLHEATPEGLLVFLTAIRSTTESDPFQTPDHCHVKEILDAAILGKMFSCPVISRLLIEGISIPAGCENTHYRPDPYLTFAIWAIGDVTSQISYAAQATVGADVRYNITEVDPDIVKACRSACSSHWTQLQDMHLRYMIGPSRFHQEVNDDWCPPHDGDPLPEHPVLFGAQCPDIAADRGNDVYDSLRTAKTTHEILAIRANNYGLHCGQCRKVMEQRYKGMYKRLEDFACTFVKPKSW